MGLNTIELNYMYIIMMSLQKITDDIIPVTIVKGDSAQFRDVVQSGCLVHTHTDGLDVTRLHSLRQYLHP